MSRLNPLSSSRRLHVAGYSILGLVILALGVNLSMLHGAQKQDGNSTVAKVAGNSISMEELLERAAPTLDQVEGQRLACLSTAKQNHHQVLQNTVEVLVREQLSTNAAAKAGVPKDEWLAKEKERQVAAVTTEELDQFFAENAGRLRQPRPQIEGQIRDYLGVEKLYTDLRAETEVEVSLAPYRLEIDTKNSPGIGPEDAEITVVEFSDFECPYCQRFNPTLDQVKSTYKDKVRVVFRQFPLNSIHAKAQKAAEASLCAHDQGAFWKMHDLLFAEQKDLDLPQLKEKAKRLGLDSSTFDSCVDEGKYAAQVAEDVRDGSALGVTGTPSVFINGRPVKGVVAFEDLAKIIDEELESAG